MLLSTFLIHFDVFTFLSLIFVLVILRLEIIGLSGRISEIENLISQRNLYTDAHRIRFLSSWMNHDLGYFLLVFPFYLILENVLAYMGSYIHNCDNFHSCND